MATGTLIKRKPSKQTEVWEFEDFFRKKWMFKDEAWLAEHIKMLKEIGPVGYLKGHGADDNTMWIDTFKIKGQLATTFPQSPEFIEKVTDYCLEHYNKTKPYAHFDWELSNMIIDNDNITLLDWDNCAIYPEGQIIDKMDADFKKAFADKFDSEQFRKRIASETKTLPKK